jgi:hypothetical protein
MGFILHNFKECSPDFQSTLLYYKEQFLKGESMEEEYPKVSPQCMEILKTVQKYYEQFKSGHELVATVRTFFDLKNR